MLCMKFYYTLQINFLVEGGVIEPMCKLLEAKDTKVMCF